METKGKAKAGTTDGNPGINEAITMPTAHRPGIGKYIAPRHLKGESSTENAAAAQAAAKSDYFPAEKADQSVAHTKLLGGGESTTIEFVAPEPGTYRFLCSYSSHWSMMQGDMIVIAK